MSNRETRKNMDMTQLANLKKKISAKTDTKNQKNLQIIIFLKQKNPKERSIDYKDSSIGFLTLNRFCRKRLSLFVKKLQSHSTQNLNIFLIDIVTKKFSNLRVSILILFYKTTSQLMIWSRSYSSLHT